MQPLYCPAEINRLLRRGIENGWWTIEDLDRPSLGFASNLSPDLKHFPHGYQGVEYSNPLRSADAQQIVSISDPRDFTPAPGHTPALDPPAPLSEPSDDHRPPVPTQPVSVTDDPVDPRGITVYTNADDPDLWF
jgi:hypothetical protein